MMNNNVAHLTSAHPRYDTRIFLKQCRSLAANQYNVTLVVADGKKNEIKDEVSIVDVGYLPGRTNRIFKTTKAILNKALSLDAHIYHIHDPELIFVGLKLKKMGKKVIFDAHEDFPKQILGKTYLKVYARYLIAFIAERVERFVCSRFDGIVTATSFIRDKFLEFNHNTIDINNYPTLEEIHKSNNCTKQHEICYVGDITKGRGVFEIVKACGQSNLGVRLNLVGIFAEPAVEQNVKHTSGWKTVNELGFLNRNDVYNVMSRSVAGLVTFLPEPNHVTSQPNKMFEYMSAGIPVIASNFTLWKQIIENNHCGICVDPFDSMAIADAIDYLVSHPEEAQMMGENGRRIVKEKYNWLNEEEKLLMFYKKLLGQG
jgi:glycosyltransferase involved in cell wall biosynthesis